jgi:hypothetical protein
MATKREKIQSVIDGSAASYPYEIHITELNKITPAISSIQLVNNGDQFDGDASSASTYDQIDREWNGYSDGSSYYSGWQDDIADIQSLINNISVDMSSHYEVFWNGEFLDYKTRPPVLKGARDQRISVAKFDATNSADYTEWDGTNYLGVDYYELGTITYGPSAVAKFIADTTSVLSYIESTWSDGTIAATEVIDVTNQRALLTANINPILTALDGTMTSWISTELVTYPDAIIYLQAFGFVGFAENPDPDVVYVVDKVAGNLP